MRRQSWLSYAVGLLIVLLAGSALYLGGAGEYAISIAAPLAMLALTFSGVPARGLPRDPFALALAIAIGISVIQLISLPPGLLRLLDPRSAALSAAAVSPFQIDRATSWRSLHMDPGNGAGDLLYLVGIAAAYLAAKQTSIRSQSKHLLSAFHWLPLGVALIALAHKLWSVDDLYGFYRPVAATPPILGPFLNPNHLAAYTSVGSILWTGRALGEQDRGMRVFRAIAALMCGAVCVLTLSRGGIAALIGGLTLFAILTRAAAKKRRSTTRPHLIVGSIAAIGVSAGVFVAWEALRNEYASADTSKIRVFAAAVRTLRHHWILGAGPGGLHAAATQDGVLQHSLTMERAENLLLDLSTSFGVIAGVAIAVLAARWMWKNRPSFEPNADAARSVFAALATLALHDLVDFSLWLAGTGFLAATMAGFLAGDRARPASTEESQTPRGRFRPAVAIAVVACIVAGVRIAHQDLTSARSRLASMTSAGHFDPAALRTELIRHPGDPYLPLAGSLAALNHQDRTALRLVNRSLEIAPTWAEPHILLASLLLRRGFRSQGLLEIRLGAALEAAAHPRLAALLLQIEPTLEEMTRAAPSGLIGERFLRAVAVAAFPTPLGPIADEAVLRRIPTDADVLWRQAERSRTAGDVATAEAGFARLAAAQPASAAAYVGLARIYTARHAYDDAARVLEELARVHTLRGDARAMRAATNELVEMAGADVDRRVRALGLLGTCENDLHNDAAALAAFERANAMALPDHPYLTQIIDAASRLNDSVRIRDACNLLADEGVTPPAYRRICIRATHGATGASAATFEWSRDE
jgi:tetratricopeptide (TPR) repeat protein